MSLHDYCPRCNRSMVVSIMSRFNTDVICLDCEERERRHPDYQNAAEAEAKAVLQGDRNYAGIGKPQDL